FSSSSARLALDFATRSLHDALPIFFYLPLDARLGVIAALEIFSELTKDIDRISAAELLKTRGSLSPARKALVLSRVPRIARIRVDRKSTRLNSSHVSISYAVFCLKK